MTSSIEEAYTQQIALSHSLEKYLPIDSFKMVRMIFHHFVKLQLNAVLTDNNDLKRKKKIESYVEVIS